MSDLLEASNYHQTRRHYAESLEAEQPAGRSGHSLCSSPNMPTRVYDQEYHVRVAVLWSLHPVKQIVELPLCKRCEKAAARRGGAQ